MLVVRPMSSATRTRSTWSPQLAGALEGEADQPLHGGCWMLTRRPPDRCFAQEHTKHRGWSGFSGIGPGEVEPGAVGLAAMSSRCRPAEHRSRRMMVSRVGW